MSIIDEFDQELKRMILSFEENDKLKDMLYHYKNFERAKDIISNSELNLTCFRHLQKVEDSAELAFSNSIINELVELRPKSNYFWYYFSKEFPKIITYQSVYVRSFSHARDDSYLFEKFADRKKGCAFGFDFKLMRLNDHNVRPNDARYLLKVLYEKDVDVFKTRINMLLDLADQYLIKMPDETPNEIKKDFSDLLATYLMLFFPVLKKNTFANEKEYRHVMPGIMGIDGNRYPSSLDENRFRGKKDPVESHYADVFEKNSLKEILIGSKADPICEQEIFDLLKNFGYELKNIQIIRSNV